MIEAGNTSHTYEESIKSIGFDFRIWAVQVVVLFALYLFGCVGNVTVLIMLLRKKLLISSTIRHLILNLVIADLLVVNFCILTLAIWHYTVEWLAGDFMCRFSKYLQMFSLYASTFIIVVISVDRCLAIVAPFSRFQSDRSSSKNHRLVAVAWILAAIFSVPQAVIFKVEQAPLPDVVFYQCVTFGSYTETWQEPLYTSFTLCANFLLPFCLMVICYALIFHKLSVTGDGDDVMNGNRPLKWNLRSLAASLRKCFGNAPSRRGTSYVVRRHPRAGPRTSSQSTLDHTGTMRSARLRRARMTSLLLAVIIVLTFLFCWGPYYIRMVGSFIWTDSTESTFNEIVFFFGMSNSVINPLIYGAFHAAGKNNRHQHPHLRYTLSAAGSSLPFAPQSSVRSVRSIPERRGLMRQHSSNPPIPREPSLCPTVSVPLAATAPFLRPLMPTLSNSSAEKFHYVSA